MAPADHDLAQGTLSSWRALGTSVDGIGGGLAHKGRRLGDALTAASSGIRPAHEKRQRGRSTVEARAGQGAQAAPMSQAERGQGWGLVRACQEK
jgi:hypothetical protein